MKRQASDPKTILENDLIEVLANYLRHFRFSEPEKEPDKTLFGKAYTLHRELCLNHQIGAYLANKAQD